MDATVMTTTNQPTLGIALPIYNERHRIPQVFSEVRTWAQRRRHWQFLFIDDGSTDGSGDELDDLIQEHGQPNIHLLRQPANRGKGLAIKEGFAHLDNDLLCFTDGDLAYSFDHIDKLEAALAHFDVVIANRHLIPQHESVSLRRRILGECFNRLARRILGLPYRDTQAGLKGFRAGRRGPSSGTNRSPVSVSMPSCSLSPISGGIPSGRSPATSMTIIATK